MVAPHPTGTPVGCVTAADPVVFGRRLAALREAARVSPAEASVRAGVTASYWSVIESAKPQGRNKRASIPRVPVVRSLADAVDADKAELLDLAGYHDSADLERARVVRIRASGDGDRTPGSNVDLERLRLLAPDLHATVVSLISGIATLVTPEP